MNDAEILYNSGDYKSVARLYRMQIEQDEGNSLAHQELARCMYKLQDFSAARDEANRALEWLETNPS